MFSPASESSNSSFQKSFRESWLSIPVITRVFWVLWGKTRPDRLLYQVPLNRNRLNMSTLHRRWIWPIDFTLCRLSWRWSLVACYSGQGHRHESERSENSLHVSKDMPEHGLLYVALTVVALPTSSNLKLLSSCLPTSSQEPLYDPSKQSGIHRRERDSGVSQLWLLAPHIAKLHYTTLIAAQRTWTCRKVRSPQCRDQLSTKIQGPSPNCQEKFAMFMLRIRCAYGAPLQW
jgi:hypothetical protein